MSVQVIDYFEFPSTPGPGMEQYTISFDDVTLEVTVAYSGSDGEAGSLTEEQRGRAEGESIWQQCDITTPTTLDTLAASLGTPFAYVVQSENDPACTPLPPLCDLAFTSVDTTPETQQGLADGTITAVATSSYGGIEYSLNNIDWQSSGNFTGLAAGNYTVYARDWGPDGSGGSGSDNCEISRLVTIDSFYNPIIGGWNGLPVVRVSAGNYSRWSAAYNPIVINFQRKDFNFTSVTDGGGGNIQVALDILLTADQIALALANNVVLVSTKYNLQQPALSHAEEAGVSVLTFANIYYGTDTGFGLIDLIKPNYKIEIEITYGLNQYGKSTITGTWSPNLLGITRADMASFLQSLVNANDDFDYTVLNYRDLNRSASYTLRFREVWDTGSSTWYVAPNPLYVVYAAMQLGDARAGNMADYVPFYAEPNPSLKAKFMTVFPEPIFNPGLPFDLSFIYSEYLVNYQLQMRTTSLDINREVIGGSVVDQFLLNDDAGFLLTEAASKFIIQRGALPPVQDDDVIDYLGVNRLMMAGDPAALVWYYQIQLFRGTSEDPYFVTKPLIVRIAQCSDEPYCYLKWINHLGGWDYFRFGFNQALQLNTSNDTVVKRNVFNWATDNTIQDVIKKSANKKITFGVDNFEASQIAGLEQIETSPKVQMLIRTNPIYWQTVIMIPGTFNLYETKKGKGILTFSANLIDINIQRQ